MFRLSQRSIVKSNIRQFSTKVQNATVRNVKTPLLATLKAQQPYKLTSLYCAKRFYAGKNKK